MKLEGQIEDSMQSQAFQNVSFITFVKPTHMKTDQSLFMQNNNNDHINKKEKS